MNHLQRTGRRRHLLVVLMGAPTIIAALGLTAGEPWRFQQPDAALSIASSATSLADAIARDDVQQVYEFIRAGQDPNGLVTVRHPTLSGGRSARVSPLLWAVATGANRSLSMLLGFGAHVETVTLRQAHCLAKQLGHTGVARQLELRQGAPFREPCPTSPADGEAPLHALAEPE